MPRPACEGIKRILGPLLRWSRAGTTRRGNPWAAVVMTFILVQVSPLRMSLVVLHAEV